MATRNPERDGSANLGWLADNGYVLEAKCGCNRITSVPVIPLAVKLGRRADTMDAARKLKCQSCGRRYPELRWLKWDQIFRPKHSDGRWISGG